jgi:hypothetical protein
MREVQHPDGHPWVTSSVVDEEAIDHERVIGSVAVTGEVVNVRVAQRVDFDLLADPVAVQPSPPRITVGGMFEMGAPQALELAEYLREAASRAEEMAGRTWRLRLFTDAPGSVEASEGRPTLASCLDLVLDLIEKVVPGHAFRQWERREQPSRDRENG